MVVSKEISFRLYAGETPSTFILKNNNLEKMKEFINCIEN
jgi:hypothetical protein